MAIKTYVENGQTCYFIRYTATSRVNGASARGQRDLGAVTLTEAKSEHEKLKRQLNGRKIERERFGLSWRDLLQRWHRDVLINDKALETTTRLDSYNTMLRHTKPWMQIPVDQLKPMSAMLLFEDMRKLGLSRGRAKSLKSAINVVFDWAILNRVIPTHIESPARGVRLPKCETKKQPVLNREEIKTLLRRARDLKHEYYFIWSVAFNTGCRSGELWALRWTDIDFERRLISVTKSYSNRLGRDKSTKTNEWRDVPINPQLDILLKELKMVTASTGYVLPRITSWRRGEASKVIRAFCVAIGIREINFHAMRSCFAIQCLESGIDVATTMKLGGWTSVKSFQHYIRLAGVEVLGATDKFRLLPGAETMAPVCDLRSIGI